MKIEYLDIILAIPLIWGAFMGFKKGLILELASIVALVLGIYGAVKFSDLTADYLNSYFEISSNWIGLVSFLVTFIGIVICVSLLGKVIDKMLKLVALGFINRLLGLIFGLVKYAIILSFVIFFFENLNQKFQFIDQNLEEITFLYTPIKMIAEPIRPLLDEVSISKVDEIQEKLIN
jgi:membrane protein required for colicin V production